MERYENLKLDYQLCFSLYAASKEVVRLHDPMLKAMGITFTQYICLLVLWEKDDIMIKEMCERTMLDTGTITPLLKKLEAAKLIERKRKKEDNRAVVISLTQKGRDLKEKAVHIPFRSICSIGIDIDEALELKRQLDYMLAKLKEQNSDC